MIMGDNNIPKELKDEYYTKAFIEIKKYLNEEYDKILKKLNIIIEDRPYTHYDFALINAKLIKTRKENELLKEKDINKTKYIEMLHVFSQIEKDYNL